MVRGRSEVWKYFKIEGKHSICTFCGKEAYKNPSRMPYHLTRCSKCPKSIKERMRAELPQSLRTRTSTSSHSRYSLGNGNSNTDFEIEGTEMELFNQGEEVDEVENVIYIPDHYHSRSKNVENAASKSNEHQPEDEFTLFGKSVAYKLRNIKNDRARVIAQHYINTILFRAEMTNFNENVSLPTADEFPLFNSVDQENTKPDIISDDESTKTEI